MVVVDLDGTLLDSDRSVSSENNRALERVRAAGGRVVAATGRSLGSVREVLQPDAPFDAVAFSTGAGIVEWQRDEILSLERIAEQQVRTILDELLARDIGFMLHPPDPSDGTFAARRSETRGAADFDRRIEHYGSAVRPWRSDESVRESIEILLIEDPDEISLLCWARQTFPDISVIHATSPIDHQSLWIQLLAPNVGKATACRRLAERWGVGAHEIVGVGNDYNDIDFLDWVAHSYIVANAPPPLLERYRVVASNDEHGVAAAIDAHF